MQNIKGFNSFINENNEEEKQKVTQCCGSDYKNVEADGNIHTVCSDCEMIEPELVDVETEEDKEEDKEDAKVSAMSKLARYGTPLSKGFIKRYESMKDFKTFRR